MSAVCRFVVRELAVQASRSFVKETRVIEFSREYGKFVALQQPRPGWNVSWSVLEARTCLRGMRRNPRKLFQDPYGKGSLLFLSSVNNQFLPSSICRGNFNDPSFFDSMKSAQFFHETQREPSFDARGKEINFLLLVFFTGNSGVFFSFFFFLIQIGKKCFFHAEEDN